MTDSSGSPRGARLARALSWSALSSAVVLLINVATGILLARELGPELRGALAAAMVWPVLVGGLGVLGLMEALSYHTARSEIRHGELVGSALALAMVVSAAATGVAAVAISLALDNQGSATVHMAYIYLAYIPINIFTLVLSGYVNGRQRFDWFQVLRIVVIAGSAIGLAVLALTAQLDVRSAVLVYLGASLVTTALAVSMVVRLLDEGLSVTRSTASSLFAFGRRSFASTAAWRSNERIDQPIIAALLPPAQLGLYVVAVTLSSLAGLVGASVVYIGLPAMAALTDAHARLRLARTLVSVTLLASALLSLIIFVAAPLLLDVLFGSQFASVLLVARILVIASVVLSVNRAMECVLTGLGRPFAAAKAELLALPVTAAGLVLLLPTLGIVGAGWASLAAYSCAFALMTRSAASALGTSWTSLLIFDRRDVAAIADRWRAARFRDG